MSNIEERLAELRKANESEEEQIRLRKQFEESRLLAKSIMKFALDTGVDLALASVPLGTPLGKVVEKAIELSRNEIERRI